MANEPTDGGIPMFVRMFHPHFILLHQRINTSILGQILRYSDVTKGRWQTRPEHLSVTGACGVNTVKISWRISSPDVVANVGRNYCFVAWQEGDYPLQTLSKQTKSSTGPAYSFALLRRQIHELKSIAVACAIAYDRSDAHWVCCNWHREL